MNRFRPLLPLLLFLLATTAAAQDWRGLLDSTRDDLEAQRYARARHTTIKLINSMMDNLNSGRNAAYTMALTVMYRAVAEAGMGDYNEADWYRHVALAMDPRVGQIDLKSFGDAGAWIATPESDPDPDAATTLVNLQDPVCTKKRMPKYPLGAVLSKVGEPVLIHVLIDRDGTVRHPTMVTSSLAPTLIYAATEAVKTWEFQPAMADGRASPMGFDLTVNFVAR
jgi:TonB family protein